MKSNISVIADGKEKITVVKEYSQDEINKLRENYVGSQLEIAELNDKIKLINETKKVFKKEADTTMQVIRKGFAEESIDAFYIDEQDLGERQYYNQSGEIVHTRKLKTSERQLKTSKFMHEQFN